MAMLEIRDLNVYYGGIHALKGISLEVEEGQIVSMIGSNGAGKSSMMNAISGIVKYKSGEILYKGQPLPTAANKVVRLGVCQVPEGRLIFANLTVYENLKVGAYLRSDKDGIERDLKRVYEIFPRLEERKNQIAGTLSGGEQQMLAMGRGIMSAPDLIMLDEPSLGLAPLLVRRGQRLCSRAGPHHQVRPGQRTAQGPRHRGGLSRQGGSLSRTINFGGNSQWLKRHRMSCSSFVSRASRWWTLKWSISTAM